MIQEIRRIEEIPQKTCCCFVVDIDFFNVTVPNWVPILLFENVYVTFEGIS